jgi:DNA-binding MarR family transcriptional regulator
MVPPFSHRVILMMALKYAQRRSAADLAGQIRIDARLVVSELRFLERAGYVRHWPDRTWSLTSLGNTRRNQLTA